VKFPQKATFLEHLNTRNDGSVTLGRDYLFSPTNGRWDECLG